MPWKINPEPGTLFIVATPIGHLQDISLRALETLKAADRIVCEDTRETLKLLRRYAIEKPLVSLHDHNERERTPALIERLRQGESLALVCDGGTPLISDPGWWLVHRAIAEGLPVTGVPGPSALIDALVLSGLPSERFVFEGFLPAKSAARRRRLEALVGEGRTVLFYESPHRLLKTLRDVRDVLGEVPLACAREMTKLHEEVVRGTVTDAIRHFEGQAPRGECVVVLASRLAPAAKRAAEESPSLLEEG